MAVVEPDQLGHRAAVVHVSGRAGTSATPSIDRRGPVGLQVKRALGVGSEIPSTRSGGVGYGAVRLTRQQAQQVLPVRVVPHRLGDALARRPR